MGMGRVRAILRAGIDGVFPPSCLACGCETAASGLVCVSCFAHLPHLGGACARCALPLPSSGYANALGECPTCALVPPPWKAARAAFVYEGTARKLVLQLKYADRLDIAPFLVRAMRQSGADLLEADAFLVPVPLHRRRLWRRRFNQAALLARGLSRYYPQTQIIPDALVRQRATTTLARLDPGERLRALDNAFVVSIRAQTRLAGKHVILVDDVLTTGATASICAKQLLQSGAGRVDLLVAARTVKLAKSDATGESDNAEE